MGIKSDSAAQLVPGEPWRASLQALEGRLQGRIELRCLGGFVINVRRRSGTAIFLRWLAGSFVSTKSILYLLNQCLGVTDPSLANNKIGVRSGPILYRRNKVLPLIKKDIRPLFESDAHPLGCNALQLQSLSPRLEERILRVAGSMLRDNSA